MSEQKAQRPVRNKTTRHARRFRDGTGAERVAHGYLFAGTFEIDREDWWACHPDCVDLGEAVVTIARRRSPLSGSTAGLTSPTSGGPR